MLVTGQPVRRQFWKHGRKFLYPARFTSQARTIANGDITLRYRDAYLPYTVDKFIDIGERTVTAIGSMAGYDLRSNELEPLIPHVFHYLSVPLSLDG